MYCRSCGGTFGDPYEGINVQKNVLNFYNYGGAGIKWSYKQTFRYQNKRWELIGITNLSFLSYGCRDSNCKGDVTDCELNEKDVNISTKKMHIIVTSQNKCIPEKDYWKKLKTAPLILLQNFNINTEYLDLIN